ncbi:ATP-binding protein [Novosphingobium sp. 1949]|uniref:histidine kinase n=1 Tax=Novosphingobium organovorum TaxID=2930092 RepID=A0ABT0BF14_9SPHN|nr:ATP-binding protein [Novosphingobium organovorum]MCJ2183649.1 ATP-binding protein [Novosphingobium organovorum]
MRSIRLRERIAVIVVIHLLAMIGIIVGFLKMADPAHMEPFYRLPDPTKVALIAAAFERTPPDTHAELDRAFSDATLQVALHPSMPVNRPGSVTPETLEFYRDALGGRPFRLQVFGSDVPRSFDDRPGITSSPIRITVQLPDGQALAIEQKVTAPVTKILSNLMLFLLVVAVLDVLIVFWLAAQSTRPVERLARAVREDRLDTVDLPGPREFVELGKTIRDLRTRLKVLLEERTRMLAAIAHDYRTYLTRMDLRSEFIEDSEQRRLAGQDIEEMRELLADTLTFARESSTCEADPVTCEVRTELAALALERKRTAQDIAIVPIGEAVLVRASHLSFQRMMANLLDNALRYGGGSARVRVLAERTHVHISVEDEGPGVPEIDLERLLQPFERSEPSRARHTGGVGLGLSIVQALARRYEGDVRLENRSEGGFRAILSLRRGELVPPEA